ncbi:sulfate adenylyltransferase subunit 1 [Williamwhitmania taraxaci]|uniref:sulfate adenylyltransferase n=1 Tax=Williamwhitmania taraxaci TaxID=1640674 RepID=A0A1G6HGI1_9BACT|nr:GTP-binding protein [Williamwhitmania taraxaci]SDB93321.1 sulfate adenylyltransferase subunit 1 [Williamwhitmania taraxaci]
MFTNIDSSNSSTRGYLDMELLRFTTAGSVDDGKSTLIGRLLYDSKAIFEDQLEAIQLASVKRGDDHVDLALLTDGLRAEREQGITIDVAYRYFATPKRKFIIADTPGHIQYTRNMVTGASTANLALILVDGRKGVLEQTIRHSYIAAMLGIPQVMFCINKMDLVDYSQPIFDSIKKDLEILATKIGLRQVWFTPISALHGDNVVEPSTNMPWYTGQPLLAFLETVEVVREELSEAARFPVQNVIRPQSDKFHDYRSYGGRVAGGVFRVGDKVAVLPTGLTSTIAAIDFAGDVLDEARQPMSVSIRLADDIDVSRGNIIVKVGEKPRQQQDLEVMLCWLNELPLIVGGKYGLKHTSADLRCIVKEVVYKVNINTLEKDYADKIIGPNDIALVKLKLTKTIFFDSYRDNRNTGSLILIDEGTNVTVSAGMIQ